MGRKKIVTTEEHDDEAGELMLGEDIAPDPDEVAERDIVEELKKLGGDDGVKWSVHKIAGKPGERGGWCADYATAELSLEGIRETFGGGRYRIQGTKISGGQWVAKRTLEIMDVPKPITAGTAPGIGNLSELVAALKPGDSGFMPLLLAMIKSQGDMMTAIASRPAPVPDKGPTVMEIIAMIKTLQPPEKSDSVELLLQGLKLGRDLGGGGGETGMLDIAAKGLEMIKPMIEAQAAKPAPVRRALPPPTPALAPPETSPAPPTPEVDPMLQKLNWLRHQVNILCYQAIKGGDPELYAAVLLDNLPAFITEEEIYERIAAPDAIAQLAQLDARVQPNAAWFEQFRQAILAEFADDTPPDVAGNDDETAALA